MDACSHLQRLRRRLAWLVATAALMLLASRAAAFVEDPGAASLEIRPPAEQTLFLRTPAAIDAEPAAAAYAQQLARTLGGAWRVTSWNQYAGAPRSVVGPGIVVAPSDLAAADPAAVASIARAVIAAHPDLFLTDGSDLVLARVRHGAGRWGVLFHQMVDGVRIQGAQVVLVLHDNGRLFAFGASVYRDVDVALVPSIEATVARAIARAAVPYDPALGLSPATDALLVVPLHVTPGAVDYRLAHRTDVPTSVPEGVWRTWVDAHSGAVLRRDNRIEHFYEGTAAGAVEIQTYCDGETPDTPFRGIDVVIDNVGTATTEVGGGFATPGDAGPQSYTARFDGPHFDVECNSCTDAQVTGVIDPDTPEAIVFDGANARNDERDVFYYADLTKRQVQAIDPSFDLLKYTANVNIDATCNAGWNGTVINFRREGDGCANTGTIGSIIAHEMGHGVQDWALGGGQGPEGLGEGNADVMATFVDDASVIGIGFDLGDCVGGVRDCDNDLQYPEDAAGGAHAAGRIICGFHWDCRMNLEASLGAAAGETKAAELWHFARALFMDDSNNQQDQVERTFWADDDDGDLENGTPHFYDLCDAATRHGYTCTPAPDRIDIVHTPLGDTSEPGPFVVSATVRMWVNGVRTPTETQDVYVATGGGPFSPMPMTPTGGDVYQVTLPVQPDGTAIAYYIRVADSASGMEAFDPPTAPAETHVFAQGDYVELFTHTMESDLGYVVGAPDDDATDGIWERGDPVATLGGDWQPEDDHTENGTDCWITGNPPDGSNPFAEELDGRTSVSTPLVDLTGVEMLQGTFWYWTRLDGNADDYLDLRISSDGGSTWTVVEHITEGSSPDWAQRAFRVTPWQTSFTSQMQFRFVAEDGGSGNVVEALVDDFFVETLSGGTTAVGDDDRQASAPVALRLGEPWPNPFNPSTTIGYALPSASRVRLAIYDVAGRHVRTLVEGRVEAGEHAASWDGRNDAGERLASGAYVYQLAVDGRVIGTRTAVLLK